MKFNRMFNHSFLCGAVLGRSDSSDIRIKIDHECNIAKWGNIRALMESETETYDFQCSHK